MEGASTVVAFSRIAKDIPACDACARDRYLRSHGTLGSREPSPPNSDQFDRKLGVILFSHVCRRVSPRRPNEGGCSACLGFSFSPAKFRSSWGMDSTRSKETKEAASLFLRFFILANRRRNRRLLIVSIWSAFTWRGVTFALQVNVTRGKTRKTRVTFVLFQRWEKRAHYRIRLSNQQESWYQAPTGKV